MNVISPRLLAPRSTTGPTLEDVSCELTSSALRTRLQTAFADFYGALFDADSGAQDDTRHEHTIRLLRALRAREPEIIATVDAEASRGGAQERLLETRRMEVLFARHFAELPLEANERLQLASAFAGRMREPAERVQPEPAPRSAAEREEAARVLRRLRAGGLDLSTQAQPEDPAAQQAPVPTHALPQEPDRGEAAPGTRIEAGRSATAAPRPVLRQRAAGMLLGLGLVSTLVCGALLWAGRSGTTMPDARATARALQRTADDAVQRLSAVFAQLQTRIPDRILATTAARVPAIRREAVATVLTDTAPAAIPVPSVAGPVPAAASVAVVEAVPAADTGRTPPAEPVGDSPAAMPEAQPQAAAPAPPATATRETAGAGHEAGAAADGRIAMQVDFLLRRGDAALAALRLSEPFADSAAANYAAVLAIDPLNPAAQQGMERIVAAYAALIRGAQARGDANYARQLLGRARAVLPDSGQLPGLEGELAGADASRR